MKDSRHPYQIAALVLFCVSCAGNKSDDPTSSTGFAIPKPTDENPDPTWSTTTGELTDEATTGNVESTWSTEVTSSTTTQPDFGAGDGCNRKIDFLFVLDRENGMSEYWPRFWGVFPDFIDDVLTIFENFDMHFMVVDGFGSADGEVSGWGMNECISHCSGNNQGCAPDGPVDYPCSAYDDGVHLSCQMNGAGIVFPAGWEAASQDCGVVGGRRFITSDEQPDLGETLKCISQVGYGNATSRPELAMLRALSSTSAAAECNDGFLRPDALLVIVYYTYLGTKPYAGHPTEWADELYAHKDGDKDRVAVIGIIDDDTYDHPSVCPPGNGTYAEYSANFLHFQIEHKVEGSLCAVSYAPYFSEGLQLIADLCDAVIPE